MATQKRGKKPDKRPARSRYWTKRTLEDKKVRNIMRQTGMSEAQATKHWRQERGNRRTPWTKPAVQS